MNKQNKDLELSIVIPVYRNRETIKTLFYRLTATLNELEIKSEIIFVNDNCPDRSLGILQEIEQRNNNVLVLSLTKNIGQNQAVLIGLDKASSPKAVIMDADLQDRPEFIPDLLEAIAKGYDVVFGGKRGNYNNSYLRSFWSLAYRWMRHLISGVPTDAGSFMVINRKAIDYLLQHQQPFIVMMLGFSGLSITSILLKREKREIGKSSYSFTKRLSLGLKSLFWAIRWRLKPRRTVK